MKLKAIRSFSNVRVGNIVSGQEFNCDNSDLIQHFLEYKLIEPIGDHAYENKMLSEDHKKKDQPAEPTTNPPGKKRRRSGHT